MNNWIDSYVELMKNTESAKAFDIWTAYSVVASALRRKVSLQLGRLVYYPNLFVVLVAEPGIARKTEAIKHGVEFLQTIPDVIMSADSATKEALTDDIEQAGSDSVLGTGEVIRHSSLSIISKEFESFLGQKKENTRMLTALTDLYDSPDDWGSRTRHGKSNKLIRPWINLLAATTPDSLASSLPATAIGGGLTSRILFIWADGAKCRAAIPSMTPEEVEMQEKLRKDLFQISLIAGSYAMSADCRKRWIDWYNSYDEHETGKRICIDRAFSAWYSRKPTFLIKVAMLTAAAESNKLIVEWSHIERAIEEIRAVEYEMGNAFKAIGKSEVSAEVDMVHRIIAQHSVISEKALMSAVWRDIDDNKFSNVIGTLLKTGSIVREYKGPGGEPGIWYRKEQR